MNKQIQMIPISKLHPHPNNPRKDLGDLTELTDSIRKSGILQNLTVVPYGSGSEYTVIIGHRRRAAAKLAGLEELPCIITDMSKKEQLAAMVAENMQRSDLTVLEQAEGIQLMLDFGDSIEDVAEATGLSQSTVRRRVKLVKYDREKVKASFERGATLFDYEELEKVKDPTLREEMLEYIGTSNFNWKLKQALNKEKEAEYYDSVEAELKKFAKPTDSAEGLDFVKSYREWCREEVDVPADDREYFYKRSDYSISVYVKPSEEEMKERDEQAAIKLENKRARAEKIDILDRISAQAYESRKAFIRSLNGTDKLRDVIMRFAMWAFGIIRYTSFDEENFAEFYGERGYEQAIEGKGNIPVEKALLVTAYWIVEENTNGDYHDDTEYEGNNVLDRLYAFLEELGYELSDEEREWKEGTHVCYMED